MNQHTLAKSSTGRIFLVTGLSGGRELFLGKAVDEPREGSLRLLGRAIGADPRGALRVRPFETSLEVGLRDAHLAVHGLATRAAVEEGSALLRGGAEPFEPLSSPLLHRWIEAALSCAGADVPVAGVERGATSAREPFLGEHEAFLASAEELRRALARSPQVTTTRELDKIAELEGDLWIEIARIASRVAVRFHQILAREGELTGRLQALGEPAPAGAATLVGTLGGWTFLATRLRTAKDWARRAGRTALVRELSALLEEGILGVGTTVLEHAGALDTLATESLAQYGIDAGLSAPAPSAHAVAAGVVSKEPLPALAADR
jgi:hypothetical protein